MKARNELKIELLPQGSFFIEKGDRHDEVVSLVLEAFSCAVVRYKISPDAVGTFFFSSLDTKRDIIDRHTPYYDAYDVYSSDFKARMIQYLTEEELINYNPLAVHDTIDLVTLERINLLETDLSPLDTSIYGSGAYSAQSCQSWYTDRLILIDDAVNVHPYNRKIHKDNLSNYSIVFSSFNCAYIDTNRDSVYHGYVNQHNREYFYSHDEVYCDGEYYPNAEIASLHGVYFDEDYDEYRVLNKNGRYHELKRLFRFYSSSKPKFSVGFEIEKEDGPNKDNYPYIDLYHSTGWIKENDSSLDPESGYELISPAFDLFNDGLDEEINGSSELQSLINAKYSSRCGGHINIASSIYTPRELFEGLSSFLPLLYAMYPDRMGLRYSRAKEKFQYMSSDADKYAAVFIKDNVLEFRIFSAVTSVQNLLWRRDLMRIMCKNINKSELDVVRMLCNIKSPLYTHLRKIYSQEEIMNKVNLFVNNSTIYNSKKINSPKKKIAIDEATRDSSLGA